MKKLWWLLFVKIGLLIFLSTMSDRILVYKGLFAYPQLLREFGLPKFLYSFANFDGVHYIKIAREGYHQFDQAFFPLFPLFIKFLSMFLRDNYLLAGLLIANASFLVGLYFFYTLMEKQYSTDRAFWMGVFLITYPTSFFFHTVYTESLFFLLFVLSLYCFYNKRPLFTFANSLFLGMTRILGVLVVIPYIVEGLFAKKKHISKEKLLFLITAPFIGLGLYMIYLNTSIHDPLAFFHVQPSFGANRSTQLIFLPQVVFRYMKIFITANHDLNYFVALNEFCFFVFTFLVSLKLLINSYKEKHNFGISMAFISLLMILIPSLTGTFSSIPRYTLLCFSSMIVLSHIKSARIKIIIAVLFLAIQTLFWPLFIQGYFIS